MSFMQFLASYIVLLLGMFGAAVAGLLIGGWLLRRKEHKGVGSDGL